MSNATPWTFRATNQDDPSKFVRFIWSDDGEECDFIAAGFNSADDEARALNVLIQGKGHEGADVAGWTVDFE